MKGGTSNKSKNLQMRSQWQKPFWDLHIHMEDGCSLELMKQASKDSRLQANLLVCSGNQFVQLLQQLRQSLPIQLIKHLVKVKHEGGEIGNQCEKDCLPIYLRVSRHN